MYDDPPPSVASSDWTARFESNRKVIDQILATAREAYITATPHGYRVLARAVEYRTLETGAPSITGAAYVEERKNMTKEDRAVELLREQRESVAEQRAQRIVKSVQDLSVADLAGGTIVSFTKNYGGKRYTYVALKLSLGAGYDLWYITGQSGSLTNLRFEEFLASDGGFDHFKLETIVAAVDDDE